MKQFRLIYAFLLAMALPLVIACTNDDATGENHPQKDGKISVRLRLSQAAPATTRADDRWQDSDNAEDKEMMNIWTVVAVRAAVKVPTNENDENEEVVNIWACTPSGKPDQEVDFVATLPSAGKYRFYSFANMSPDFVMSLLGIDSDEIQNFTSSEEPKSFEVPSNATVNYTKAQTQTVKVNGNLFNSFDNQNKDNGFGFYGIPMSNVQYYELNDGDEKDLIVVRMLAKMELQITNTGADAVTIESIILTDITQNAKTGEGNGEGTANLKLFPKYNDSSNANTMDAVHGDIQPNLADNASTAPLEIAPSTSLTIGQGNKETITFYINESATPTGKNQFDRFYLKLNLSKETGTGKTEELRYTLIDDNGTQTGEKWNYIARNDYRIIPISLGDYKLELIPYDFPAIGVYPASVKEEDGLNTITFHDYGHFHLMPKVTQFTANGTNLVPYGTGGGKWSLVSNDFGKSWTSKVSFGGADYDNNTDGFYRSTDDPNYKEGEGSETGGVPQWWENTSKPQWASDWAPNSESLGYQPFIFGYIANPKGKLTNGDRKVYHEFTIQINDGGPLLTYRLYMILDTDQMMYPGTDTAPSSSRALGAPAARHTHGH